MEGQEYCIRCGYPLDFDEDQMCKTCCKEMGYELLRRYELLNEGDVND